jgi:uncharacterized protein (TIGR02145 family)
MKNNSLIYLLLFSGLVFILLSTCKEKPTLPTVSTTATSNLTANSVTTGGEVSDDGKQAITARGICWSTKQNPTIADNITTDGSGVGSFTTNLTALLPGVTYYIAAYATNSIGTAYGSQIKITTEKILPSITTVVPTVITSSGATSGGIIPSDGGDPVTVRGVCWATTQNPTTSNIKTIDGNGIGVFSSTVTGLSPGTTYYLRAYATNSIGTAYGNQLTLNALAVVPVITTTAVTSITPTTAVTGGNVTSDGGAQVTAKGVCWSTSQNPTTAGNKSIDGTGTGTFTSNLTGLLTNTTYYVRAYATNSAGTVYGSEVNFKTSLVLSLAIVNTSNPTNVTSSSAVVGGNVISDGNAAVTDRGIVYSTNPNPTTANSKFSTGVGTGAYTMTITGLSSSTTYYVRAYAINNQGTSYGSQVSFTCSLVLSPPTVVTVTPVNVTTDAALTGGNVTNEGNVSVTERGVVYATTPNPTIINSKIMNGTGSGYYPCYLTGLSSNTTYYYRAYAINSQGTSYGDNLSFTTQVFVPIIGNTFNPGLTYGSVMDIEGVVYKTIVIGTQTWMAENLQTSKLNDGTIIPNISSKVMWADFSSPACCWYENNVDSYRGNYGVLYNWFAVNSGNLCPSGWHVPTDTEWTTLSTFLGDIGVAGGKMKEIGITHWAAPNTSATNSSGFTGVPGGIRDDTGAFYYLGYFAKWWSSTAFNTNEAWYRGLNADNGNLGKNYDNKLYGYSVRCIKN